MHPAVAVAQLQLGRDREADHPGQRDQQPSVLGLAERRQPPQAADRDTARARISGRTGRIRLDHAEHPSGAHGILDHRQIARFENIERQLAARQQQRTLKREHRKFGRQLLRPRVETRHQVNSIADSLRRAAMVAGSSNPHASNSFSNCSRAASSFQARLRRMMSSRCSAAASRSPLALSALARS